MVNPGWVLRAFRQGADGVVIAGCHPGDCHYTVGNYYAKKRYILLKELMKFVGFDGERFKLLWASASEGKLFAEEMTAFTQKIKEMGPQEKLRRKIE